jgi:hypothetical protein
MTWFKRLKRFFRIHQTQFKDRYETFEKCPILFKAKEGENFNYRNTLSILRINPPKFGGGLKFEPDAGIGQKGAFCKGLDTSCLPEQETL